MEVGFRLMNISITRKIWRKKGMLRQITSSDDKKGNYEYLERLRGGCITFWNNKYHVQQLNFMAGENIALILDVKVTFLQTE